MKIDRMPLALGVAILALAFAVLVGAKTPGHYELQACSPGSSKACVWRLDTQTGEVCWYLIHNAV